MTWSSSGFSGGEQNSCLPIYSKFNPKQNPKKNSCCLSLLTNGSYHISLRFHIVVADGFESSSQMAEMKIRPIAYLSLVPLSHSSCMFIISVIVYNINLLRSKFNFLNRLFSARGIPPLLLYLKLLPYFFVLNSFFLTFFSPHIFKRVKGWRLLLFYTLVH